MTNTSTTTTTNNNTVVSNNTKTLLIIITITTLRKSLCNQVVSWKYKKYIYIYYVSWQPLVCHSIESSINARHLSESHGCLNLLSTNGKLKYKSTMTWVKNIFLNARKVSMCVVVLLRSASRILHSTTRLLMKHVCTLLYMHTRDPG